MNRSVWDDDKCGAVWSHLVTDVPYDWSWNSSVERKFSDITGITPEAVTNYSANDLSSAKRLRTLVREIFLSEDGHKANEIAQWIVVEWGGIRGGKDTIPSWMKELLPFDGNRISDFIRGQHTDRISSWSKILSFFDCERYAVYDSRTAVAINSAMVISGLRPKFHMPTSQNSILKKAIPTLRSRYEIFHSGYPEYLFLLERFVELRFTDSILDAERKIFAGADKTAQNMMMKFVSA